jgi:alpha-ketoglutarate-dependent taurine dioxygenase
LKKGDYGYSIDDKNGSVTFWNMLPPFMPHPDTGEKIWFNSVQIGHHTGLKESPMYPGEDKLHTAYSWDTTYGDGTPIELEVIQHVRACMWQSTYGFQWRSSDMLVVDNMEALHGRLSFTGNRKILAFLMAN